MSLDLSKIESWIQQQDDALLYDADKPTVDIGDIEPVSTHTTCIMCDRASYFALCAACCAANG